MISNTDYSLQLTDTEGGDFIHHGKNEDGKECIRGKIIQSVDDDGSITFVCKHCGRTWPGGKLNG